MKKLFSLSALFLIGIFFACSSYGQSVNDSVTISPGYTDQAFYSLQNGLVQTSLNTDWDLAFQISGFEAAILINSKNNVHLYKANKNISEWSSMITSDTNGLINSTNELYNQDTTWFNGAFNGTADLTNQFDLGWGVYDFNTHIVSGDSVYFIQIGNGDFKKLKIDMLQSAVYYFTYANLDGSNEIPASIAKSTYQGKNFGYYSIVNGNAFDREPNKYTWDLSFQQYLSLTPFIYKVAGVLSNDSVQVAKAYPVDINNVNSAGQNFSYHINQIGYDWKSYDFNLNLWTIEDSLVYFVYDRSNTLWKLIFTGFGGSANGNYYFTKEQVSTGLNNSVNDFHVLSIGPNPASDYLNLVYFSGKEVTAEIQILDLAGKQVFSKTIDNHSGLNELTIPLSGLSKGIYLVRYQNGWGSFNKKIMVN